MDLLKLAGFAGLLFLFLEAVGAQIDKLKPWLKRVITFALMGGASVGLGFAAPFAVGVKVEWLVNSAGYFAAEYFIFLFLRNELHLSAKDFFLRVFCGNQGGGIHGPRL